MKKQLSFSRAGHYKKREYKPTPTGSSCPSCKQGELLERKSRFGPGTFIGCSNWPRCDYTRAIKQDNPDKAADEFLIKHGYKSLCKL